MGKEMKVILIKSILLPSIVMIPSLITHLFVDISTIYTDNPLFYITALSSFLMIPFYIYICNKIEKKTGYHSGLFGDIE